MDRVEQVGDVQDYQGNHQFSSNPPTISLKPPKRTMSAYVCFSRKVYACDDNRHVQI